MLKNYYKITKPGIIYGNGLSGIAGFFLASPWPVDLRLFIAMLVGLSLVIASACVFNNIYDREMDSKMERTKNRSLASGKIKPSHAIIFAVILLILGVLSLSLFANLYPLYFALLGFLIYVFLYTPLKTKTVHATLIGALSGAMPPVVGYIAVTNSLDAAAIIVFLILVFWQMPHFYAIGIRRLEDYKSVKAPILPASGGVKKTKVYTLVYTLAFLVSAFALSFYKYTGFVYLTVMIAVGFYWLKLVWDGFKSTDDKVWSKKVFLFSLVVLLVWCAIIPIDRLINLK